MSTGHAPLTIKYAKIHFKLFTFVSTNHTECLWTEQQQTKYNFKNNCYGKRDFKTRESLLF